MQGFLRVLGSRLNPRAAQALTLVSEMRRTGVSVNVNTYNAVINQCVQERVDSELSVRMKLTYSISLNTCMHVCIYLQCDIIIAYGAVMR